MRFTRIQLKNWKNFQDIDVPLEPRVFVVGPNASGKSNFLDAFRFLHDLVADGGGLAQAVRVRDGVARIRSLHAKANSRVSFEVEVGDEADGSAWVYGLGFTKRSEKDDRPRLVSETVKRVDSNGKSSTIVQRPDTEDQKDHERLSQTALEQVNLNKEFRSLVSFLRSLRYMSLVPHLVREGQHAPGVGLGHDPLGRDLLERIRQTPERGRRGRLKRIEKVLEIAVPQFSGLSLEEDERGRPHLEVRFKHWRGQSARQRESQFSDGTLRLIAMLWALQEEGGPLLLEEPEWSLHTAILRKLASFVARAQRQSGDRQVVMTTHSEAVLSDAGIGPAEVLILNPVKEGSQVVQGSGVPQIVRLMSSGVLASEAVLPRTSPKQLPLFDRVSA